jgi:hypothetical protein
MPREGYDETVQMYRYLVFSYSELLTKLEAQVEVARIGRAKVAGSIKRGMILPPEHPLRLEFAREGVPEIEEALADGVPAYMARVVCRILAQHEKEVEINRCSRCNRIVATPLAKQCLWCGHNWHRSGK